MINFRGINEKFQNLLELPDLLAGWTSYYNLKIENLISRIDNANRRPPFILVLIQGFEVVTDSNPDFHCGGAQLKSRRITNKPITMALSGYLPHLFTCQPDVSIGNLQIGVICDLSRVRIDLIRVASQILSAGIESSPFAYFNGICSPANQINVVVSER